MKFLILSLAVMLMFASQSKASQSTIPANEGFIVAVGGYVNKPGLYRVTSRASLFQALAAAGWVSAFGSLERIRIVRSTKEDSADSFLVDMRKLLNKGGKFPLLRQGDMIYVEQKHWSEADQKKQSGQ